MPAILWSLDTCDWVSQNPDMIVETVMNKVCDGDIIIMHDLSQATQEAVSRLLPLLTEAGFKVTSVSELACIMKKPARYPASMTTAPAI